MNYSAKSLRPFIGAKNFNESRNFYKDLEFDEVVLSGMLSVFKRGNIAFYLQHAYVPDWVNNTMLFMEVDDVHVFWEELQALNLPAKYPDVKIEGIRELDWGKECFVHDPSGILWHVGTFND